MHAYVDDIVVKSMQKETLVDDLKETFDNLRVYKMMLNPAKCVFGVPASKLLGFLVSNRGIEANPEILRLSPPWLNRSVSTMFTFGGSDRCTEPVYQPPRREGHPFIPDAEKDRSIHLESGC